MERMRGRDFRGGANCSDVKFSTAVEAETMEIVRYCLMVSHVEPFAASDGIGHASNSPPATVSGKARQFDRRGPVHPSPSPSYLGPPPPPCTPVRRSIRSTKLWTMPLFMWLDPVNLSALLAPKEARLFHL